MIPKIVAGLVFLLFLSPNLPARAASTEEVKEQLRSILKENPNLILDILQEKKIELLEIVEQGAQAKQARDAQKQLEGELRNPFQPVIDAGRPVLGELQAPITIVAYSDFQCFYCARAAGTMKELVRKYPGKIRVFFKHVPLQDFSRPEALYFEALARQNPALAWSFHDRAFADPQRIAKERDKALQEIAAAIGADPLRLERDLQSKEVAGQIDQDMAEAQKFGLRGTPMFLINGVSVRGAGPLEEFEKVIRLVEERDKGKKG